MKRFAQTILLALIVSVPAFAGDIPGSGKQEPPPPPPSTTSSTTTTTVGTVLLTIYLTIVKP